MLHQACDNPNVRCKRNVSLRSPLICGAAGKSERVAETIQSEREQVRGYIRARSEARERFGSALFSDPAWEMIVHLYSRRLSRERTSVRRLCELSHVAATTGKRWLEALERQGDVKRVGDLLDPQRTFVELTSSGSEKMRTVLQTLFSH
ncbi:hypothetical protein GCM10023264_11400 [Sphingomonas daechungensis]|nr:hypothetical protein [Sphingomonas daechungensis]